MINDNHVQPTKSHAYLHPIVQLQFRGRKRKLLMSGGKLGNIGTEVAVLMAANSYMEVCFLLLS